MISYKQILLGLFICLYSSFTFAQASSVPNVEILYADMFDKSCEEKTAYKIELAWLEEFNARLPNWQSAWQKSGTQLLATAINITGHPFKQQSFTIAMSLCNFNSISLPLIVNARFALTSFTEKPFSDDVMLSLIEHEILHNYIVSILSKPTPLLKKYQNEKQIVLNHLHLLALQKAVYLKLGQEEILKKVIARDESLKDPSYKRAWEIVNKLENYASFIAELRAAS